MSGAQDASDPHSCRLPIPVSTRKGSWGWRGSEHLQAPVTTWVGEC